MSLPGGTGDNRVFVVPGNHDVVFDSPDNGQRWQQWASFFNRTFHTSIDERTMQQIGLFGRFRGSVPAAPPGFTTGQAQVGQPQGG